MSGYWTIPFLSREKYLPKHGFSGSLLNGTKKFTKGGDADFHARSA